MPIPSTRRQVSFERLRADCVLESAADGTWTARLEPFALAGTGASEQEALMGIIRAGGAKSKESDAGKADNQRLLELYTDVVEIPREEQREQEELVNLARDATTGFLPLDSSSFDAAIASDHPTVVDFWADWCMPCHRLAPVLQEVAEALAARATFAKVDTAANPDLSERNGIEGIPCVIVFRSGNEVHRHLGAGLTKDEWVADLSPHL